MSGGQGEKVLMTLSKAGEGQVFGAGDDELCGVVGPGEAYVTWAEEELDHGELSGGCGCIGGTAEDCAVYVVLWFLAGNELEVRVGNEVRDMWRSAKVDGSDVHVCLEGRFGALWGVVRVSEYVREVVTAS